MTATPRLYTPRMRREAGQLDVEIASMDDEKVFGPVLHRLTFGEAIARDLLSDYQVVVVGVDDEMYRTWAKRGEFVTRDGTRVTNARSLAGQIALAKSMRKYDLRRIISFHGKVKAAREFSADMPSVIQWMPARTRPTGPIWSEHVSGAMTSGHRDRLLLRFRQISLGERGLLSNARCLGEGVDVPSIDGVAFIDPRRSTIDIVQALGRAIRKAPDKRLGTIVLPVFLAADEESEQVLNESAFQHVWDVLKALRAHDETLGEELDELRRRQGARGSAPRRPSKIVLDVPRTVGAEFARAFDARLVEQTTATWQFFFGLLERFVEREGHALVPQAAVEEGHRLGGWVAWQRTCRSWGVLDPSRERKLEEIRGWTWDTRAAAWEAAADLLQRYVTRVGDAEVPVAHTGEGYHLGTWVDGQRRAYSQGRLSASRIARLEALPGWTWHRWDSVWDENLEVLQRYVKRTGQSLVPYDYSEDGYRIGSWASKQRTLHGDGKLSRNRIARLEAIPGWTWDVRESSWNEGFAALEAFTAERGHANVPGQYISAAGFALGRWVTYQRSYFSDRTLPEERRRELESIPGWTWDVRRSGWEQGFAALKNFAEERGDARVPAGFKTDDGFRLGQWVVVQRQRALRDQVSSVERKKLEALPGWSWSPHDEAWEQRFQLLAAYVARTGTFPRIKDRVDGVMLGKWLDAQRQAYKRGTLSNERIERIEGLTGWNWSPKTDSWGRMYDALRTYVSREKDAAVPKEHLEGEVRLGQWVNNQRALYRRGELSADRIQQLEALAGWQWKASRGRRPAGGLEEPSASGAVANTRSSPTRQVRPTRSEAKEALSDNSGTKPDPNMQQSLGERVPSRPAGPRSEDESTSALARRSL